MTPVDAGDIISLRGGDTGSVGGGVVVVLIIVVFVVICGVAVLRTRKRASRPQGRARLNSTAGRINEVQVGTLVNADSAKENVFSGPQA